MVLYFVRSQQTLSDGKPIDGQWRGFQWQEGFAGPFDQQQANRVRVLTGGHVIPVVLEDEEWLLEQVRKQAHDRTKRRKAPTLVQMKEALLAAGINVRPQATLKEIKRLYQGLKKKEEEAEKQQNAVKLPAAQKEEAEGESTDGAEEASAEFPGYHEAREALTEAGVTWTAYGQKKEDVERLWNDVQDGLYFEDQEVEGFNEETTLEDE